MRRRKLTRQLGLLAIPGVLGGLLLLSGFMRPPVFDSDLDGIPDVSDLCPYTPGTSCGFDYDEDGDGISDYQDNCIFIANTDQLDIDGDGEGDACDGDTLDADGDGIADALDNCPAVANPQQEDGDSDGIGNACDLSLDPAPDLAIIARPPTTRVWSMPGRLEYLVTNQGSLAAQDIEVEINLTAFLNARTFSATPITAPQGDGWSCSNVSVSNPISTCSRDTLGPAGAANANSIIRVNLIGITSIQSLAFPAEITAGDAMTANNQADGSIQFVPPTVDLFMQAGLDPVPPLIEGAVNRYFFAGGNLGPETENDYVAQFILSGSVGFRNVRARYLQSSGTENQAFCTVIGQTATCPRLYARSGQTIQFEIDLVGVAGDEAVSLSALAFSNAYDTDPDNDADSLDLDAPSLPILNMVQRVDTANAESIPGPDTDLLISPDDQHVYTANSNTAAISVFSRSAATGELSALFNVNDAEAGIWDRKIGISPDGENLYLLKVEGDTNPSVASRALVTYQRNTDTGALTEQQSLSLSGLGVPDDPRGLTKVLVSADGAWIYVMAARRLLLMARDDTDGALTLAQTIVEPESGQTVLAANGVFIALPGISELRHYQHAGDAQLLQLTRTWQRGLAVDDFWPLGPVAPLADGQLVTVDATAGSNSQVSVLSDVEAADSAAWWLDYHWPTPLNALAISGDGSIALTAGEDTDLLTNSRYFISALARDVSCGELSTGESYTDGVGATDYLSLVKQMQLSADGHHLYVSSLGLLVFEVDADRDGIADAVDPEVTTPPALPCPANRDSDADGTTNLLDVFPLDPNEITDADGDFVGDNADNCPDIVNPMQADTNLDGVGNACDPDDDGDGVPDAADAFPDDPGESVDTDGDGTGNRADTDDDNDGIDDLADNCPLAVNADQTDTDSDGAGNACDPDDDNDGTPDGLDAFPLDPAESKDTDRDGIGNNADQDDDNDGVSDVDEIANGTNPLFNEKTLPAILLILGRDGDLE